MKRIFLIVSETVGGKKLNPKVCRGERGTRACAPMHTRCAQTAYFSVIARWFLWPAVLLSDYASLSRMESFQKAAPDR